MSQYPGKNYTVKTKEHSKQLHEKVIEKHESGDGYKKISKSLNIPWSTIKSIIKKYGTVVSLPSAGSLQKPSDNARMGLVSEATTRAMTTLEELQTSVTKMGETVYTTTVSWVLHQLQLYGRVTKRKPLLKKTHMKSWLELPGGMWETLRSAGRRFYETKIELSGHQTVCCV